MEWKEAGMGVGRILKKFLLIVQAVDGIFEKIGA